jgi:hypothetical protein
MRRIVLSASSASRPSSVEYSVRPSGEIALPSKPFEDARFGAGADGG